MKNSVLNSPRLFGIKRKRRKILMKKTLFWLFLLLIILFGLSFLSKWQKININNVQISGNKVLEVKEIEDVVKEKISGNYLWFFPKTNFLLYPKNEIIYALKDKFKRLENISLTTTDYNTLEVSLSERLALYTWCGNKLDLVVGLPSEEKCYFLDEDGYVFDEAPYFSGNIYFKFYGNVDINQHSPIGSFFYKNDFNRFIFLISSLEKIDLKPMSLYIKQDGNASMVLSSSREKSGPEVIFKTSDNIDNIIANLQSVLSENPLQLEFKNGFPLLSYIDLRYGNKVYFKFR